MKRLTTFRADSSCSDLSRPVSNALRPNEPKATVVPRVSTRTFFGLTRLVCHLRYFTFFGSNIIVNLNFLFVFVGKNFASENPNLDTNVALTHIGAFPGEVHQGGQGHES